MPGGGGGAPAPGGAGPAPGGGAPAPAGMFGGGGAGFGGFATTKKGKKGFFKHRFRRPINIYTYGYPYPYYGYPYYYPYTYGDDYDEPASPLARMLDRIDNARAEIDMALAETTDPAVRAALKAAYAQLSAARENLVGTVGVPPMSAPVMNPVVGGIQFPLPGVGVPAPAPATTGAPPTSATVCGQGCAVGGARYGNNGPT